MLKSILFMLVMICFLTTPTRAYEACRSHSALVAKKANVNKINTHHSFYKTLKLGIHLPVLADDICAFAVREAEQNYQIKENLLQTISSVESGRWSDLRQRRVAWPWTVQHNGKGHYYNTKEEAVSAVKALYEQGITNIDVGCMQINLKYHGHAFNSIEDAIEPKHNVDYSAGFLRSLYENNGFNWKKTAMQYHSKLPSQGLIYKNRLEKNYAKYGPLNATGTLF